MVEMKYYCYFVEDGFIVAGLYDRQRQPLGSVYRVLSHPGGGRGRIPAGPRLVPETLQILPQHRSGNWKQGEDKVYNGFLA